MKAWELHEQVEKVINEGPGSGKAGHNIGLLRELLLGGLVMLTPDGHTYPITEVHYNDSLGVYIVSSWKKES